MAGAEIPNRVIVHVTGPIYEGLVAYLTFGMALKNDFGIVLFIDESGVASVTREELLHWFHEEWKMALMDYVDPLTHFTGKISGKVMNTAELQGAVAAFERLGEFFRYPRDYAARIKSAARRGQEASRYKLKIEIE